MGVIGSQQIYVHIIMGVLGVPLDVLDPYDWIWVNFCVLKAQMMADVGHFLQVNIPNHWWSLVWVPSQQTWDVNVGRQRRTSQQGLFFPPPKETRIYV